jgi:tetratricopeptide (TPR) repeat protein
MLERIKLLAISSVLALSLGVTQSPGQQVENVSPEAKQHYSQARKLLTSGEREKAFEELKAAIQLAPQFVNAHRDLLDNQRDKAESFIAQYEQYVKDNPNSSAYHYLLGKVYQNANKRDKAEVEYKKALELDPQSGWAMLGVLNSAPRSGDNSRAIELLEKASKNAGDDVILRRAIASNLISNRLYDRALEEAERILKLDPETYEAYTTKWQARLNISLGADETRAEILKEIENLEKNYGKEIRVLLVVQNGYQMLENQEGAQHAKDAILAIDPKYYERQPFSMFMVSGGKQIRLTGNNARLFNETFRMKDDKQKLEAYSKLESSFEDADAKLYVLYPAMLRSYVTIKEMDNAERVFDIMVKANVEQQILVDNMITLSRSYFDSKTKLDTALNHVQRAIEELRKPRPKKEGVSAKEEESANERSKIELSRALHLQGQILLEKGMVEQAVQSLEESAKLNPVEENLFDLGLAQVKLGKQDEAVNTLSKVYAFEGKSQKEAKENLEKIYGARANAKPLPALLSEAVEQYRAQIREESIKSAIREIAQTETKEAPLFTLSTTSGQKVQLADLRGKVLLLNFWATW